VTPKFTRDDWLILAASTISAFLFPGWIFVLLPFIPLLLVVLHYRLLVGK